MHRQQLIQHLAAEAQPVQVVHDGFCAGFGDAVNPEYFIAVGRSKFIQAPENPFAVFPRCVLPAFLFCTFVLNISIMAMVYLVE